MQRVLDTDRRILDLTEASSIAYLFLSSHIFINNLCMHESLWNLLCESHLSAHLDSSPLADPLYHVSPGLALGELDGLCIYHIVIVINLKRSKWGLSKKCRKGSQNHVAKVWNKGFISNIVVFPYFEDVLRNKAFVLYLKYTADLTF